MEENPPLAEGHEDQWGCDEDVLVPDGDGAKHEERRGRAYCRVSRELIENILSIVREVFRL